MSCRAHANTDYNLSKALELWREGCNIKSISEIIGINRNLVSKMLRSEGIDTSTASSWENTLYAGNPRDVFISGEEESDYFVGLLLADGCVHENRLRIELNARDEDILHSLVRFLNMEVNVRYAIRKTGEETAYLAIRSERLTKELAGFGIVPRKTGIESCPDALQNSRHFWRGVVDGDGCILISKEGTPRIYLCGTEELCTQFLQFCRGIDPDIKASVLKSSNIFRVTISSSKAIVVMDELYRDCKVKLERKYSKYVEVKALYELRSKQKKT